MQEKRRPAPQLSIVVCTYNRKQLLTDCLQSLVDQTLNSNKYEIILVDNNSSDGTAQQVSRWQEKYSFLNYIHEDKQGLSHARNAGWKNAQGKYVAFTDDDIQVAPDWAEKILAAFTTVDPEPASVGGKIVPRVTGNEPWWFSPRLELRSWGEQRCFLNTPTAHYGFSGGNMAFSQRTLEAFDGFNPEFGMCGDSVWLGEETDLFMRIYQKQPYFWYDPTIEVKHYVAMSQLRLRDRLYRKFQTGRTRRQLENRPVTLGLLLAEIGGVLHLLREKLFESPFSLPYIVVSIMERIADRTGFIARRAKD
jgi:glycosyltransferase involved in cell wall biosynthesis